MILSKEYRGKIHRIWDDLGMQDRREHGLSWYDRLRYRRSWWSCLPHYVMSAASCHDDLERAGDCSHKLQKHVIRIYIVLQPFRWSKISYLPSSHRSTSQSFDIHQFKRLMSPNLLARLWYIEQVIKLRLCYRSIISTIYQSPILLSSSKWIHSCRCRTIQLCCSRVVK